MVPAGSITSDLSPTCYACITYGSAPLANPSRCCEMFRPQHSPLTNQRITNYSFTPVSKFHLSAILSMPTGAVCFRGAPSSWKNQTSDDRDLRLPFESDLQAWVHNRRLPFESDLQTWFDDPRRQFQSYLQTEVDYPLLPFESDLQTWVDDPRLPFESDLQT